MTARQPLAAGAIAAGFGTAVLAGWMLDITAAKSVMAGWRVMVPATAMSFVPLGLALMTAAGRDRGVSVPLVRTLAGLSVVLPLATFIEYLTGLRTGVESWFGVSFDEASPVAGRMSPLTSACFIALSVAMLATTARNARAIGFARIASGATLLTAWLATMAVAFDTGRIADVPRFPGMAVLTIALMAVTAWGVLAVTFERDSFVNATGTPASRAAALIAAAFVAPLLLGWVRDATYQQVPQQMLTSLLVFSLSGMVAAIAWNYASRMSALRRDRERTLAELEQRVAERTAELASSNAELRVSKDRLLEADRRKDEFLATLAHELRNPLAPIRNAVAVLRSTHVTEGERETARTIIDRQVAHMARLIDDLLDVSRITVGKLPMRKSHLLLADVLNLAVATVRPHLDESRHHLTVLLPDESIVIDGDEARLSQVFANLLHNASKYTEPGGEIVLTASRPSESEVTVAVRDNGIGIPAEFLPRLFEKFSQVAPALDRSQGGLGLGLSLVHGIVTLHGGRVEARSAGAGRGSEFLVHLPVLAVGRSKPAPSRPAVGDTAGSVSRRVLVVDDNADSAESMAMLLRGQGHQVETAHDGEDALAVADRFRPEAVLLDLGMPKLNGFEVCKRIRQQPWGGSVLIIAQTGWGQEQDRQRTVNAGFDAHLTKPVDPDAVHDLLLTSKSA
ncbi:MAG TPA: ATP-binding protein [Vicinamibacterales bacterium]|nr:ATP-binding protein [Vicinamibacterales bacterium]